MATQLCSGLAHLNLSSQPHSNKADEAKIQSNRRRRTSKNKVNEVSTPSVSNLIKGNKNPKKTVAKTIGEFKCTSESCGKTWSSVHAWASPNVICECCNFKGKIVDFKDEECELDYYECPKCRNSWQSIHDKRTFEEWCDICDVMVHKQENTQKRHGRHYWYKCMKADICGVEWEDFCGGKLYSQRCKICYSPGEMFRTRKQSPAEQQQRRGVRGQYFSGPGHDVEGCDMCQELQRQGKGQTCRRKKLVVFEVIVENDGSASNRIIAAV